MALETWNLPSIFVTGAVKFTARNTANPVYINRYGRGTTYWNDNGGGVGATVMLCKGVYSFVFQGQIRIQTIFDNAKYEFFSNTNTGFKVRPNGTTKLIEQGNHVLINTDIDPDCPVYVKSFVDFGSNITGNDQSTQDLTCNCTNGRVVLEVVDNCYVDFTLWGYVWDSDATAAESMTQHSETPFTCFIYPENMNSEPVLFGTLDMKNRMILASKTELADSEVVQFMSDQNSRSIVHSAWWREIGYYS